jgi:hypothetical protein
LYAVYFNLAASCPSNSEQSHIHSLYLIVSSFIWNVWQLNCYTKTGYPLQARNWFINSAVSYLGSFLLKPTFNWATWPRFPYQTRKMKTRNKHPLLPLIKHKNFFHSFSQIYCYCGSYFSVSKNLVYVCNMPPAVADSTALFRQKISG